MMVASADSGLILRRRNMDDFDQRDEIEQRVLIARPLSDPDALFGQTDSALLPRHTEGSAEGGCQHVVFRKGGNIPCTPISSLGLWSSLTHTCIAHPITCLPKVPLSKQSSSGGMPDSEWSDYGSEQGTSVSSLQSTQKLIPRRTRI